MKKTIYVAGFIAVLFISLASCTCKSKSESKATQDVAAIDAAHSSKNGVDWVGDYEGTIPCADCEGIEVHITLNSDETYQMSYLYLDKGGAPEVFSGIFTWDTAGEEIALSDIDNFPSRYKVIENKLIMLDMEGNIITGQYDDMYVLTKSLETK